MTADDLRQIEAALNITLPTKYRETAEAFPFQSIGTDCIYWFFNKPEDVIQATRFPLEDGGYAQANWKPTYLAIGSSPAGDLYLIDVLDPILSVWLLCHETHLISREWPTFTEFVREWQAAPEASKTLQDAQAEASVQLTRRMWRYLVVILLVTVVLPGLLLLIIRLSGR